MAQNEQTWRRGMDSVTIPASERPGQSVLHIDALAGLMDLAGWTPEVSREFEPDENEDGWYWVKDALFLRLMADAGWRRVGAPVGAQ